MRTVLLAAFILGSCAPPDPLLHLAEVVPDTGVVDDLRGLAPEYGLVLVVTPDRVRVAPVGSFEGFNEDSRAALEAVTDFAVVDGVFPEDQQRGMLASPLYEALQARAQAWKDEGELMLIEEHDFRGDLWLLMDRRVPFEAVRPLMYTAGQAQYSNFELVSFGASPVSDAPALSEHRDVLALGLGMADDTCRPNPLVGLRLGEIQRKRFYGEPIQPSASFEVDDRGATFTISTPKDDAISPLLAVDAARMDSILRADAGNPRLYPSFAAAITDASHPVLPSLELLLHLSKGADDRMMAAFERHMAPDRATWIEGMVRASLAQPLEGDDEGLTTAWLSAAAVLGGQDPAAWGVPPQLMADAARRVQAFEAQPRRAKPLGIYSESEDLQAIFARDRFLLSPLHPRLADERVIALGLLRLLEREDELSDTLMRDLARQAQLTNPSRVTGVLDMDPSKLPAEVYLLPPATSREVELMERFGGTAMVGPRTMELFVRSVREGTVSLTPREDSGWYDYQQWALEPLLTLPEAEVLQADEGYVERLEKAFEAAVAMRRETHIKSLQLPSIGASARQVISVSVAPDLRVEPLPAHYGRSAVVYDFLIAAVLEPYTDTAWEQWEGGGVAADLQEAQRVYRDAAAIAWADLGMGAPVEFVADETLTWLAAWWEDPRMARDLRFMIPFGEDMVGHPIAWTVLGVKLVDVTVAYDKPPTVRSLDPEVELDVSFVEARYTLPVLVFAELTVAEILDRQQFRSLADQHPTQRELMGALAPMRKDSSMGCGG